MLTRAIPSTGEQLPVIGLGTWQRFDVGNSESEQQPLRDVLQTMKRLGGKLIDSSPMYGKSESVVGDLTSELNIADNFFYATKVWTTGKQNGIDQMNESFRKMRRNTMNLMQIHNLVDWQTPRQHAGQPRRPAKEPNPGGDRDVGQPPQIVVRFGVGNCNP